MASTIKSTTQQQIDVEEIQDNIILQKDGSCSLVLKTNAINFGLLAEEEQDASIYAYAAFLNSLTFTIQILIRSDIKDISGYIKLLEEQELKQPNPIKKNQISQYKRFITTLITERNVLEKAFYIIIPFSTLELGISQSFTSSFFKSKSSLPFEKGYIIEKARATLEPKRDHVMRQLARIGLSAKQMNTQELIQLLFSMYNASSIQGQKISNTKDYTVPLVQPAYIGPKEETMTDQNQQPASPATNSGDASASAQATTPPPSPGATSPGTGATPTAGAAPQTPSPTTGATPSATPAGTPPASTTPSTPAGADSSAATTPPPSPGTSSGSEATSPATPSATPSATPTPPPSAGATPPAPTAPTGNASNTAAAPSMTPSPAPAATTPDLNDAQSAINNAASDLGGAPKSAPADENKSA